MADMFGVEENRYVSLSNKYRPQTFEDMVGQETVSKTLANAIKLGRIGHAYLFYGPRGCGKTTSARIFAKALNCTGNGNKPSPVPCGKCPQCLEIANGSDMDVLELDAASHTGVDKIREVIVDTVSLAAGRDRFKIFILDEVHMLSDSAFNALLKTIEEPPAHVVFILATTEKHQIPATISSRCQTFRFRPITHAEIAAHLGILAKKENIDITPKALDIIAAQAGGALRDALTLLDRAIAYCDGKIDEEIISDMLGLMPEDLLKNCVQAMFKKDYDAIHEVFETIQKEGYDPLSFLRDLKNALGDMFYLAIGHGKEPFSGAKELAKSVSPSFIAALTRKLNKIVDETKFSDTPLITAETGLFTVMDSALDIDAFIARLEKLEAAGVGGAADAGPTAPPEKKTLNNAAPEKEAAAQPPQAVEPRQPETVAVKNSAPPQTASDKKDLWQLFKASFKNNFFIFDALANCVPSFSADEWTLSFNAANAFYAAALESKIPELEQRADTIADKKIKISLTAPAEKPRPAPVREEEKLEPQKVFFQSATVKETRKTKPPEKTDENAIISTEEPFINADFSKEFDPAASRDLPEHIKKILSIIPGEVVN